ncbi:unnamed protein product [Choristocarpus tenellus]
MLISIPRYCAVRSLRGLMMVSTSKLRSPVQYWVHFFSQCHDMIVTNCVMILVTSYTACSLPYSHCVSTSSLDYKLWLTRSISPTMISDMFGDALKQLKSPKGHQLRLLLRREFDKNKDVTDQTQIESLKGGAVRGLSNYFLHESSSNDPRLKKRMDAVRRNAVEDLRQEKKGEAGLSKDKSQR